MKENVTLAAILFVASSLAAQSPNAQTPPGRSATGAVTGHVLCGDTNLPARFASVLLQPLYEPIPSGGAVDEQQNRPTVEISQTMLDGSFSIRGVKPGKYYVIVEKLGYLSPLSQLTREQLNKPDDASAALIARLLGTVTVTANHAANADLRLPRGGTISGTVRYDDGSPDGGSDISVLHKSRDGKWEPFWPGAAPSLFNRNITDDQGHYRVSGLPAGEYLIKATINVREIKTDNLFGENRGVSFAGSYTIGIYPGGGLRTKDAKPIKLQEGEPADLIDIEIPVAKMHSISGNVVDTSGRPLNAAKVSIVYSDDDTELVSTAIDKDDSAFYFYFVPEGDYTLKVTEARDVSRQEVLYPPGTMPPSHTEEKTIREYLDIKQPLTILGEMSGITATVKAKDIKSAPVASR